MDSICIEKGLNALVAGGILPACAKQIKCRFHGENGFEIRTAGGETTVYCRSSRGFFNALGVYFGLKGTNEEAFTYKKRFISEELGYLADCSRNGVLNIAAAKRLIELLALSGYTYLQLYTEDTYEVDGEPYFGHQRGRFTAEEIKALIEHADLFGIELVPCIETLAHLDCLFKWEAYSGINDINDVILCGEESTYALLDKMISSCRKLFRSKKINVGGDEAHLAGLGKYLDKYGYQERFGIISAHQQKVAETCRKHGFQPYMWGDMFFRTAFGGFFQTERKPFPLEIKQGLPQGVKWMHWDYYNTDENNYVVMLDMFEDLSGETPLFATGAWKWKGYAPGYGLSEKTGIPALKTCAKKGVKDILVTGWGDDGSEAAQFSAIGSVILLATADGNGELNFSEADGLCRLCTGYSYEELKTLECLDMTYEGEAMMVNPSKYILYNDLLVGLFDWHITDGYEALYKGYAESLRALAQKKTPYAYLFGTMESLAEVLSLKCKLARSLQRAYLKKDKERLRKITEEIARLIEKEELFFEKLRMQWYTENKPFGFDVLALRVGGQIASCRLAKIRIEEYLSDRSERIEELETERISYLKNIPEVWPRPNIFANKWERMVSVGKV